jgi:hypothetical protein
VVAHWDSSLNFLDERNKNVPALVNQWSKRGIVFERSNGIYNCLVKVKGHRVLSTANVDSPAKALHSRDVLQMRLIPAWAQPYLLNLRRSQCSYPEFLPSYDSIESLLACATLYPKVNQVRKKNVGERFSLIELSNASQVIKQGEKLARRDGRPLGTADVLVRYTGSRGAVVDFVVSRDHYLRLIKPFKGNFHVSGGQIMLKNDTLARLVMGLKIGDYDEDAHEVLHSSSGKRWNRPCDLRTGTRSDNIRDVLRPNTHGSGVKKLGKKYIARIRIMCPTLNSTVLISNDAAANLYQALVQNVPHFIRLFKAEGVFNTGKEFQAVRLRIFHAFVEEYRRSPKFLALFSYEGAIL